MLINWGGMSQWEVVKFQLNAACCFACFAPHRNQAYPTPVAGTEVSQTQAY